MRLEIFKVIEGFYIILLGTGVIALSFQVLRSPIVIAVIIFFTIISILLALVSIIVNK